jgi:hypothetical protein
MLDQDIWKLFEDSKVNVIIHVQSDIKTKLEGRLLE